MSPNSAPSSRQAGPQLVEALGDRPPRVDQDEPVAAGDGVDVDRAKAVVRERQRDPVHAGHHFVDAGRGPVVARHLFCLHGAAAERRGGVGDRLLRRYDEARRGVAVVGGAVQDRAVVVRPVWRCRDAEGRVPISVELVRRDVLPATWNVALDVDRVAGLGAVGRDPDRSTTSRHSTRTRSRSAAG